MKTKINWRNSIGFVVGADNIRLQKTNSRAAVRGSWGKFSAMQTISRLLLLALAALLWVSTSSAIASELIYSQQSDNQSTYGPSQLWSASGVNSEVADDFNVAADIDRVLRRRFHLGSGRFFRVCTFASMNSTRTINRGRSNVNILSPPVIRNDIRSISGGIDATLSPAFSATGRHFISVQPVINYWYWWSSSNGAPRGEAFYFRDMPPGKHGITVTTSTLTSMPTWCFICMGLSLGPALLPTCPRHPATKWFSRNFRKQLWR